MKYGCRAINYLNYLLCTAALVGGARGEVPQHVLGLCGHEVHDGGAGLCEWDQLELVARAIADIG